MTRLAMSALFGHLGHVALAAQSQIPLRTGDCVTATQTLDFFFKDEGEYERTHRIGPGQFGVLLNLGNGVDDPSTVEFINAKTREAVVEGAVLMHQFARAPWGQGVVAAGPPPQPPIVMRNGNPTAVGPPALGANNKCMTAKDGKDGYQPVIRMSTCGNTDKEKSTQQFSWRQYGCGAGPIRWTQDPSKCVDAVHPNKVLLTDCAGIDSQKFQFRCVDNNGPCYILAMGGRKDMCLWYNKDITGDADLQIRSCNFDAKSKDPATGQPATSDGVTNHFFQFQVGDLAKTETRPNTAPTV